MESGNHIALAAASPNAMPNPVGDRGTSIVSVQIAMIVIPTLAVMLRFTARRMSAAGLWWDDWMILVALVPSLGINFTNIFGVSVGLGRHIWDIEDGGTAYLQSLFATELIYTTALALNKYAVLLMYKRLFGIEQKMNYAVYTVGAVVTAWWIAVEVATLLQCQPIDKFWHYTTPGQCIDIVVFFEGSAIPNVIIDLVILLMPQPLIWQLRLSLSAKTGLCCVFLLGALSSVSSIGRLIAIITFKNDDDFTWSAFSAVVWYSIEPAVGITCACLPCFGPLFRNELDNPPEASNRRHRSAFYSWQPIPEILQSRRSWLRLDDNVTGTGKMGHTTTTTTEIAPANKIDQRTVSTGLTPASKMARSIASSSDRSRAPSPAPAYSFRETIRETTTTHEEKRPRAHSVYDSANDSVENSRAAAQYHEMVVIHVRQSVCYDD